MMLSNFIKVVGLSEGAKLLVSYFEKSKSERSSFGDYYLEKNWGLFETYSELLDFCAEEYNKDLKTKSMDELNTELVAAKRELFNLRFQNATNQLENTSRIKEVRKNIARIQTIIAEKVNAAE